MSLLAPFFVLSVSLSRHKYLSLDNTEINMYALLFHKAYDIPVQAFSLYVLFLRRVCEAMRRRRQLLVSHLRAYPGQSLLSWRARVRACVTQWRKLTLPIRSRSLEALSNRSLSPPHKNTSWPVAAGPCDATQPNPPGHRRHQRHP